MEITEVRIGPSDDERIAAYDSITFDDCFVIHGLRVKVSKKGDYYLFMPGRKQADILIARLTTREENGIFLLCHYFARENNRQQFESIHV